jgi:hypothetical protein
MKLQHLEAPADVKEQLGAINIERLIGGPPKSRASEI